MVVVGLDVEILLESLSELDVEDELVRAGAGLLGVWVGGVGEAFSGWVAGTAVDVVVEAGPAAVDGSVASPPSSRIRLFNK